METPNDSSADTAAEDRFIPCYGSLSLRPYLSPEKNRPKGTITGDVRNHTINSVLLGKRQVSVYLPPGYSEMDSWAYPFALLQDGQNIFDASTAVFGVEWGVDEAAERLIVEQKMAPVILVAVYNSEQRVDEYTPFPDPEHGGGSAVVYRQFLVEELIPFLEGLYSLSKRPEERAVIGSSLGGLVSLYLGWTATNIFGLVGALSPSLWWGRRGFITGVAGDPPPKIRPKIWLDAGTHEAKADINGNGVPDLIDDLRTMRAVLLSHGYKEGFDLTYKEIEGGTHDETCWSQRVGDVLSFFFPKGRTPIRH